MACKRQRHYRASDANDVLLVFLQIVCMISGQSNDDCPTNHPSCYCLQQYSNLQIICTQLGVIDSVPDFRVSSYLFSRLSIEENTRIRQIQAHAFQGLSVRTLILSRLGIKGLDEDGFRGLKPDALDAVFLDQNLLRSIAPRTFAGFTQMTQLHLENNNIQNLDGNVFSDLIRLTKLDLSYNRIDVLPEPLFSRMTSLSELRLPSNSLSEIKNNVFANLNRLNYLDLSKNRISSIDADVFQSTTSLRNLVLTGNQLSTLNSGLFRNLNSLTNLDLSRNNLNYIGAETLAGLSSLTTLKLGRNCLITLPADLLTFQNRLLTLDLTQNGIRTLPVGLFHNKTTITSLTLEQNFISSLPSSVFDGLSSLSTLNIQSNRIKVIRNDTFSYLRSLAILDLSDNLIDTIEPSSFEPLKRLNRISLKGNRLGEIQSGIFANLSFLVTIDLQQNSIISLSKNAFRNLTALRQVMLSNNLIQVFTADTFIDSPNLRSIYLTGNQLINFPVDFVQRQSALANMFLDGNSISTIPDEAYDNFKSVSVVLNNNRITSIPNGAFKGTLSITDIMLQRNQITDIEDNAFTEWRTEKITRLILNNNLLTTIRAEMFRGLRGLQELDLSNNKISFLNDNCFSALSALQILNLAGNRLVSLTPAVFTGIGSNALSLNLDSNNLTDSSLSSFALLQGLVSLVLNNNNIDQLSGIIDVPFVNLTNLELRSNNLTSLNANIFSHMPNLSTLDLGNNHLDSTALTAAQVLNNLEALKLENNMIGNISVDITFKSALKNLDLSFNHIDSDVFLWLENINSLQELRLDGNQIGRFSDITANIRFPNLVVFSANNNSLIATDLLFLTGNPSLTKLYIDDNAIESVLPDIFLNKFNLNTLSMSNNLLSIINASTFDGFEMSGKILNLSGNGITDIVPEALLNFVGLQHLDLSSNRLKIIALPTQMASLQVLRIDNNNLTEFPGGPWAFGASDYSVALTILNVSNNRMTSMSNLTIYGDDNSGSGPILLLQGNQLKNIDGLMLIGVFAALDLKDNYIEDVPPQLIGRTLDMTILDLSSNFLTDVPDTVCNASHAISYLIMSGNSIASVCHLNGIPDLSSNIETLDLSYNQLNYVHPTFWPFLGSALRNLNLSHNNLTSLNGTEVQAYCTELETLYLDGNTWNCDCNMLWLRITAAAVDVDWPVCSAPPANEGVPLECYAIDNCSFSQSTRLNERCNALTERASEFPPVTDDRQGLSESNEIISATWHSSNLSSTPDIQHSSKFTESILLGNLNNMSHSSAEENSESSTTNWEPTSTIASSNASIPVDQSRAGVNESQYKSNGSISFISTPIIPHDRTFLRTLLNVESNFPSADVSTSLNATGSTVTSHDYSLPSNETQSSTFSVMLSSKKNTTMMNAEGTSPQAFYNASGASSLHSNMESPYSSSAFASSDTSSEVNHFDSTAAFGSGSNMTSDKISIPTTTPAPASPSSTTVFSFPDRFSNSTIMSVVQTVVTASLSIPSDGRANAKRTTPPIMNSRRSIVAPTNLSLQNDSYLKAATQSTSGFNSTKSAA